MANYVSPARFYAGASITIEALYDMVKIVFTYSSSSYATELKNSIGSGAIVSGLTVTIEFTSSSTFEIKSLTKQIRLNSLEVYFA